MYLYPLDVCLLVEQLEVRLAEQLQEVVHRVAAVLHTAGLHLVGGHLLGRQISSLPMPHLLLLSDLLL